MKSLIFSVILFFLFSCSDKTEIKREYLFYANQVEQTSHAMCFSMEAFEYLEEIAEDKSAPELQKAVIPLYNAANNGKKQLNSIIIKIENIKHKILIDNGIYVQKRKDDFDLTLSEEKHFYKNPLISLADYQIDLNEISKLLLKWRSNWITNANSFYSTRDCYFSRKLPVFYEPNIKNFSNIKKVSAMLDKATRDCTSDNYEGYKSFYIRSSAKNPFVDEDVNFIFETKQSLLESLSILTQIEYQLFFANANMTRLIRSRIGCGGEYQFDKIIPLAYGKDIIQKGDSLELEIFYAFINSYKTPEITVLNLPLNSYNINPEDGKIKLKFLPKQNMILKGTVTIRNKSGVPKTTEWQKEIKVID